MSEPTTDLRTLTGARAALAAGALSPVELLDACIQRVEATEPVLQAWVTLDLDGARERARRLGESGAEGRERGPLWGIPVGIKDIVDVAGLPTTGASKVLPGTVARTDAGSVRRLREAGAIVLGKTNTQELAYGCVTPPTANPWDPARIPGGSSGGSAAAVAAGHCPGAVGTDTAGSIRIPAALCGVVGLKPRPGIVPVDGVIPLAPSLDAVGPIAGTVADVAVLWEALSGRLVRLDGPLPRLAVPPDTTLPQLEPAVAAAFAEAVRVLGRLAPGTVTADIPPLRSFDVPRGSVLMWEALQVHRSHGWWPARAGDYTSETRGYLAHTEATGSAELTAAARLECARLGGLLRSAVGDALLATPTVPCEAPTHAEAAVVEEGQPRRPVVMTLTRIPGPVNAAGLAALSVPCGFTPAGLPVGLQLIGGDEDALLRLALAYEEQTHWTGRTPPGGRGPAADRASLAEG